jgi:hypothetical protein
MFQLEFTIDIKNPKIKDDGHFEGDFDFDESDAPPAEQIILENEPIKTKGEKENERAN